jgi:hypothetical protein
MSAFSSTRLESVLQSEYSLLTVLCQAGAPMRAKTAARLRDYRWASSLHGALFDVIATFPRQRVARLREELPAQVTRRGFPDFESGQLFAPHGLTAEQIEALIRQVINPR